MDLGWFELSFDVEDVAATRDFYLALGFELVNEAFDGRVVTLQRADCRLCLYQGFLDPPETQLIFWQGDVETTARRLLDAGVAFEAPPTRDEHGAVAARLRDPDGRSIHLINMPGVTRQS